MKPLLIRNACLSLIDGMPERGDILIEGDRITAMGDAIVCEEAQVLDASGLWAAPGLVDMHVHLRDPGQTHKEDIFTGCRAAAMGGVTSVLAMPNTNPTVDSPHVVHSILKKAEGADARVYVAASITKGLQGETLNDLEELKKAGAIAVTDDGRPVQNARMQMMAMEEAKRLGMRAISHAEDLPLVAGGIMHEGEVSRELGVKGMPRASEDLSTAREIILAESYGLPIHIAHVSTEGSVSLIRYFKSRGVEVTCETGPHYFTFTHEALRNRDANFRMNPPLREEKDRKAIIEALRDGTIDAIATDHAPHVPEEKADFEKAPNGIIGLSTSLAAAITGLVVPGYLTLKQVIQKMSIIPAKILGIDAGELRINGPADICLFDPEEQWTVDATKLGSKSRNSPFDGMTLTGRVHTTICRGRLVYQCDETK